jgi:hypothetical protein
MVRAFLGRAVGATVQDELSQGIVEARSRRFQHKLRPAALREMELAVSQSPQDVPRGTDRSEPPTFP